MRALTHASYGAMVHPTPQLSSPLSTPADHSSISYSLLLASQSSPLPGRPSLAFIRSVPARSDEFPVLSSQLTAPCRPRQDTLTKAAVNTTSLSSRSYSLAQPCLTPILTTSRSFGSCGEPARLCALSPSNFPKNTAHFQILPP
jgi:hypothetical protein